MMANQKASLDHYNANLKILNLLAKVNDPFDYGSGISLKEAFATLEEENRAIIAQNADYDKLELSSHLVSEKSKNADEILTKLRNSIKIHKSYCFVTQSIQYFFLLCEWVYFCAIDTDIYG
jgi:hypothetical protein